jgi:hypothetical protein
MERKDTKLRSGKRTGQGERAQGNMELRSWLPMTSRSEWLSTVTALHGDEKRARSGRSLPAQDDSGVTIAFCKLP